MSKKISIFGYLILFTLIFLFISGFLKKQLIFIEAGPKGGFFDTSAHVLKKRLKGNKYKRSAELISAALCHLIISCNEKETIDYIEESIKWLKEINVDHPCPSNNHLFKAN